jgi:hypothetical protein
MAVPAFFGPGRFWAQLDRAAPRPRIAVVDPRHGPGRTRSRGYASAIRAAEAAGITVVGYVDTDYGRRSRRAVERQVRAYRRWYGVGGIFFDRASGDCAREPYYAALRRDAGAVIGSGARTILDPRGHPSRCDMRAADILVTFDGSDRAYLRSPPPAWVADYPRARFWQSIHGARSVSAMMAAVAVSRGRQAGFVFVTPGDGPHPYGRLPTGSYWRVELAAIG